VTGLVPPWYEVLEAVCIGLLVLLPVARLWVALDRRSQAAASARRALARSGGDVTLVAAVAACVFIVAAEDILDGAPDERLIWTDLRVRRAIHDLADAPGVVRLASAVSRLTGLGLVGAVVLAAAGLVVAKRRRDALLVVAGSLGAWLLSALLKLGFAIPRPGAPHTVHLISGYGFPSAHALVTAAVCGLLASTLARGMTTRGRRLLYGMAIAAAVITAASRVILDAHWLSDAIAGLAVGVLWVDVMLLTTGRFGARERA